MDLTSCVSSDEPCFVGGRMQSKSCAIGEAVDCTSDDDSGVKEVIEAESNPSGIILRRRQIHLILLRPRRETTHVFPYG